MSKTRPAMETLEKKMKADGYAEKVKSELKVQNEEKLEGLKKKIADLEAAVANFTKLAALEKK